MENIIFNCTKKDLDIKGLDQSIARLPVMEQYSIRLHINFDGKTDPTPLNITAAHGKFTCKLKPFIGELVKPSLITHSQWQAQRKRLGGMQVNTADVQLPLASSPIVDRIHECVQRILNNVNVAALDQQMDFPNIYRFSAVKLSDSTPLLIDLTINDTSNGSGTLGVYMEDMLNGGDILKQLINSMQQ